MTTNARNNLDASPRLRGAFTLAEMMIAIVIFGIGLTMVAGLFPAALKLNKSSTDDVVGTLMGRNALALAETRIRHDPANLQVATSMERLDDKDVGGDPLIGPLDRAYPIAADTDEADDRLFGFLLLGRKLSADAANNDYLLVAVSYRKRTPQTTIDVTDFSVNIADYEDVSTADFGGGLPPEVQQNGVIILESGRYAFIRALGADGQVVLDRRLPDGGADVWVPYEQTGGGDPTPTSPVMSVVLTRTALPEL
jgi:prepilin-type N-terminal cleavage/methylation domain-containing protein